MSQVLLTAFQDQKLKKKIKGQCFYCGKVCIFDRKHRDKRDFEEVSTKDTKKSLRHFSYASLENIMLQKQ